jgi:hypothetical protein
MIAWSLSAELLGARLCRDSGGAEGSLERSDSERVSAATAAPFIVQTFGGLKWLPTLLSYIPIVLLMFDLPCRLVVGRMVEALATLECPVSGSD